MVEWRRKRVFFYLSLNCNSAILTFILFGQFPKITNCLQAVDGERTGKRKKKKKEDTERERFIEGERKYLDQVW
jgi:hypothetical protein